MTWALVLYLILPPRAVGTQVFGHRGNDCSGCFLLRGLVPRLAVSPGLGSALVGYFPWGPGSGRPGPDGGPVEPKVLYRSFLSFLHLNWLTAISSHV